MMAEMVHDFLESTRKYEIWGRLGWIEIQRRYRRTAIGPFWTTLSVGIFIFALGFLWARLWGVSADGFLPYLTGGMVAWITMAGIITEGCSTFVSAAPLLLSVRLPLTLLSYAVVWRNVIVLFHNLVLFALVAVLFDSPINLNLLYFVPGLALMFLTGLWVSGLLGALCCRFRDIHQVVVSLLQVLMFCTPVLWSVDRLGDQAFFWIQFNIFYHYIELLRAPLLGQTPTLVNWLVVIGWTIAGGVVTAIFLSRFRDRIPYWL